MDEANSDDEVWLFQNHQWRVSREAMECPESGYWIPLNRLNERHDGPRGASEVAWVYHMSGKRWVDLTAFCEALRAAVSIGRLQITESEIAQSQRVCQQYQDDWAEFNRLARRRYANADGPDAGDNWVSIGDATRRYFDFLEWRANRHEGRA